MTFSPYHAFASNRKLELLVRTLRNGGMITPAVCENIDRYHPAIIHKLQSARHHLSALADKTTEVDVQNLDIESFMFDVNLSIDGYFSSVGSALDILAREVLTYFGVPLPPKVYYHTAREKLTLARAGDPILNRLNDPTWMQEFKDYRNTLTHELILATDLNLRWTIGGTQQAQSLTLPLPDDPRAAPGSRTFTTNADVVEYCKLNIRRILRHVNCIYKDILTRARATGSLPI